MVKVSITLPNNAQITLESEEPEIVQEIVRAVLRDLPRDLMVAGGSDNADRPGLSTAEKSSNVGQDTDLGVAVIDESGQDVESRPTTRRRASRRGTRQTPPISPPDTAASQPRRDEEPSTPLRLEAGSASTEASQAFIDFCQSANPIGDMRRLLVAAIGANRLLGMASIDAADLARLFDMVGWRHPHNFVQTLRNAARDKFRWLERIPGRTGRYAPTELGRQVTLGN